MRLWHTDLLPYLPDAQLKRQRREVVAILRDWRDKGATNNVLINRVMDFPPQHLYEYFMDYCCVYLDRFGKIVPLKYRREFALFCGEARDDITIFDGWHNKAYLRVCMANLYEKHFFGKGRSRITDEEWDTLLRGYETITGEEYEL